jgi:hypothetical protein
MSTKLYTSSEIRECGNKTSTFCVCVCLYVCVYVYVCMCVCRGEGGGGLKFSNSVSKITEMYCIAM